MSRGVPVWIGVGGNLGEARTVVQCAIGTVAARAFLRLEAWSPWYRTEPVGGPAGQGWYVNGVLFGHTFLEPEPLLDRLQEVERLFGRDRRREVRWGSRPLDLDLLLHGRCRLRSSRLTLPHPRLHLRRFVLQPLADLHPHLNLPGLERTVDSLLRDVDDPSQVERLCASDAAMTGTSGSDGTNRRRFPTR
ncbi:MAG: 2-amino-4-hydroxy-6-hydroxymethyldihydropteridine diphosphokinase [Magnetococcales bacterium]|nr:2-amino-4-hydroxy-6-hydroxymethyldihydropteridine diphosphokinase [Magnetococcales bacterium]